MQPPDDDNKSMPLLKCSILIILLFQTCALFARSFTLVKLQESGMSHLIAKDLSWLLVPLILGTLMLPILRENWPALKIQLRIRQLTFKLVIVSVALGLVLRLAHWGGLIANASFQVFNASSPNSIVGPVFGFECPGFDTLAFTILISAILTPLLEEIINRGFVLQSLLPRGRWVAIAGSAISFSIFHQFSSIPFAIVGGTYFAMLYLKSRSLWACIIAHSTYNALSIVDWQCFQIVWNPTGVTPITRAVGGLASALFLISLVLAALLVKRQMPAHKQGRIAPRL
jgi:membrane protease YdiL (CAAX protease family)